MIEITKNRKVINVSKNLRGVLDYRRKSPVNGCCVLKAKDSGVVGVWFDDGAQCVTNFASYTVAKNFLSNHFAAHLEKRVDNENGVGWAKR